MHNNKYKMNNNKQTQIIRGTRVKETDVCKQHYTIGDKCDKRQNVAYLP